MRVRASQIHCISIGAAALTLAVTILLVHAANTADVRVVDGDTLQIDGVTYRLYGIDAPERKQVCARPQGQWWCGEFATRELEVLVNSGPVRCERLHTDVRKRVIARCWAGRTNINSALVRSGLAWAYRKYSLDYIAEERTAQREKRGVWSAPNIPPWHLRKLKRLPIRKGI